MKDIKLIVATHKKFQMPKDSNLYLPLHVGREGKEDLGYTGDNTGDNISMLNPYYCELTGLYWAWKNLDCDYLGLVHYRRYFTKNSQSYSDNVIIDDVILSQADVEQLLDEADVVVPKKRKYYIETLYSHYSHTLDGGHLDKTREIISDSSPDYLEAFDKVMNQRSGYMFNMFIMKKEAFNSYCQFVFGVLEKLEKEIDISEYSIQEARVYGYISELLMDVWLFTTQKNYKEIAWGQLGKKHLVKKTLSFINRKYGIGKKQTHF